MGGVLRRIARLIYYHPPYPLPLGVAEKRGAGLRRGVGYIQQTLPKNLLFHFIPFSQNQGGASLRSDEGGGKRGRTLLENRNGKFYGAPVTAVVRDGWLLCPLCWKKLARVEKEAIARGIVLQCKGCRSPIQLTLGASETGGGTGARR